MANKQDLPNALPVDAIVDALNLHEVKVAWHIQKCVVTMGIGIYEGLDWLAKNVKHKK